MFTGIVEELGEVVEIEPGVDFARAGLGFGAIIAVGAARSG